MAFFASLAVALFAFARLLGVFDFLDHFFEFFGSLLILGEFFELFLNLLYGLLACVFIAGLHGLLSFFQLILKLLHRTAHALALLELLEFLAQGGGLFYIAFALGCVEFVFGFLDKPFSLLAGFFERVFHLLELLLELFGLLGL